MLLEAKKICKLSKNFLIKVVGGDIFAPVPRRKRSSSVASAVADSSTAPTEDLCIGFLVEINRVQVKSVSSTFFSTLFL